MPTQDTAHGGNCLKSSKMIQYFFLSKPPPHGSATRGSCSTPARTGWYQHNFIYYKTREADNPYRTFNNRYILPHLSNKPKATATAQFNLRSIAPVTRLVDSIMACSIIEAEEHLKKFVKYLNGLMITEDEEIEITVMKWSLTTLSDIKDEGHLI
ncbi:hypothetical protein HPP92_028905 [Vanilla planifolia]|uniref:Uncharacterized protein n=1 Tax=Vanilla planifolia TaxID=51239 RepID=A0A835P5L1_VANPL|nr:hypothetical protein HPP92_028905 [Vanilla planifolia]KAG0446308.1 hypothetical protein HPP92_028895 [Vanilla planifolia]